MNTDNIQALIETLESDHVDFDMDIYEHECGTPACIAGHAACMNPKYDQVRDQGDWKYRDKETGVLVDAEIAASNFMQVPYSDCVTLFRTTGYWVNVHTDQERHEKITLDDAVQLLKNLLKTGEVDHSFLGEVDEDSVISSLY